MPTPTTVSTCSPQTEHGKHVFEIFGYSQHRNMGLEQVITSGTFSIGGHDWALLFYPDGYSNREEICIFLKHLSHAEVRASCELRMVDQTTGQPSFFRKTGMTWFNPCCYIQCSGLRMNRREFEASVYLRNDHLTIECIVTVRRSRVSTTQFVNKIEAPPSSGITEQLAKLLEAEENADVTFSVGGETIGAHKILLAVRSPVFRAELFGPMKESKVTIEDMQPAVFRALLHFIYTDSLPDVDQNDARESNSDLIWHLLVAADRYAVDRLKSLCESILCKNLDVETLPTTLALAYQHNCDKLKDICLEFISSSSVMDALMATDGYKDLKTTCPSALIDMFEKTLRSVHTKNCSVY
ncbi:hypothetical protein GQ55_6G073700 [Panicum hallii var. hallii]|uniref:BTB domain-containing protein n=1 Tax=Panicum hallii var. hallii TaxID=1504633 RepID=A0A2T7D4X8_9POAL|nr:hypothetical protein GQ55_6G073700 [Panicum hallii var. hallii]